MGLRIDLKALAANFQSVKRHVGADLNVMAVVKPMPMSTALWHARTSRSGRHRCLAWHLPEEGIKLRNAGVAKPNCVWRVSGKGRRRLVFNTNSFLQFTASTRLRRLIQLRVNGGEVADVHARLIREWGAWGFALTRLTNLQRPSSDSRMFAFDGLMTHFAAAEEPSCGPLTKIKLAV